MIETRGAKVLVVEDDEAFARILERRLGREGYAVSRAVDGREGMKAIVTQEPDLVISDWMMPHVDGLELCQSVKTGLGDAAPFFILLTAKDDLNDRVVALQTGADDYIVKPVNQDELLTRVRNGLRFMSLRRELRRTVGQLEAVSAELEAVRDEPKRVARLPLCPACGKVQVGGDWRDVIRFVEEQGLAGFDRTTCPECVASVTDPAPDPMRAE